MTTVLEWSTIDKREWGPGPWQGEPDKAQWVDEATGLDCLIVRGPHGGWCGYVGVPDGHPWHGKDYGQCVRPTPCEESYCGHSPESRLTVHGGVTYADGCQEPTPEMFQRWEQNMAASEEEAQRHPRGDSARARPGQTVWQCRHPAGDGLADPAMH